MNNIDDHARILGARTTNPTPADLAEIKAGTDGALTTWFLNRGTFTAEQMAFYPYDLRRTYVAELQAIGEPCATWISECRCTLTDCPCSGHHRCHTCCRLFDNEDSVCSNGCPDNAEPGEIYDEIRFFATDDGAAMAYLLGGYQGGFPQSAIASLCEIQTTVREVYAA